MTDGRLCRPCVYKGKRPLVKGAPGSFLWGRPGAVAPPASFNVQEVPAQTDRVATPVRAHVVAGEGGGGVDGFGEWGGGRMVFAGDGFAFCFRLVF